MGLEIPLPLVLAGASAVAFRDGFTSDQTGYDDSIIYIGRVRNTSGAVEWGCT